MLPVSDTTDISVAADIAQADVTNNAPVFTDNSLTQGTVVEDATVVMDVEGDSIISNGGFESGNLDGWIVEGDTSAVAVEGGATSGNFQVGVQPTDTVTLLTQNATLGAGNRYFIRFSVQGGSADSTVSTLIGGIPIFTLDSASYPDVTPIEIEIFAGMDFPGVGLSFQGSGAAWHIDDFEVVPVTSTEVIPASETTSGTLEFTDADVADVHAIAVAPRSGDYLGTFGLALTDSTNTGTGYIDWNFSVENNAIAFLNDGESLTQIYDVTIDDGHGGTVTQAVTVTIDGHGHANVSPVAVDDTAHIQEDGAGTVTGNVLDNDSDPDAGTLLSVTNAGQFQGEFGTLTLAADGSYTYALDESAAQHLGQGQVASDSFGYSISDNATPNPLGASAVLAIDIEGSNDAPVAADDVADVAEDGTLVATGNVLANDSDPDAGSTLAVLSPGTFESAYGTLNLAADGSFTYLLNDSAGAVQGLSEGEVVTDTFAYAASDGLASSPATLSIRITGSNDAPIANADVASAQEDGGPITLAASDLLANDTDADTGDSKAIVAVSVSDSGAGVALVDGNIVYTPGTLFQSLGQGATATDSFTYTMADGSGAQSSATVAVTVTGVNDAPVLAVPIADRSINAGTAFSLTVGVDTFTDVDAGDTLAFSSTLSNGDALPSWLVFDPLTRTFSGTPGTDDAGNLVLRVNATDSAGASAFDEFALEVVAPAGKTIIGTNCSDTLVGTDFDDVIDGRGGADFMRGGRGDDKYYVDSTCDVVREYAGQGTDTIFSTVTYTLPDNVENITLLGCGDIGATGNALDNVLTGNHRNNALAGGAGNDILDGGAGADTMTGGSGDDTYVVDNAYDKVIESAGGGSDTVRSSISFALGSYVENLILTGSAAINGTGNSAANLLVGNSGINILTGAAGNDIIQGLAGNDVLSDSSGRTLFDGGAGNDALTGNSGNEMFIGGIGNDTITTGTGADIIAFNAGGGQDLVNASTGSDNVLSLGGGIDYADLKLTRSGTNLVLQTGGTDQITFKDWYSGTSNRSVGKLQVFTEAMPGFNQNSSNPLLDNKVEQFNFTALANAFDAAGQVSGWALTNALLSAHLSGSDTEAIGGDLAYQIGKNGTLSGIGLTPAQDVLNGSQFGSGAQTLRPIEDLQKGQTRLS